MRLTPKPGVASHLSQLFQLVCSVILVLIQDSRANCYTSEIRIPTLQNTKHIEVTINVDDQIVNLEESIRQLTGEIDIEKSQTPIFLAVLCLAGQDLSETVQLSEQKTLYAAFVLPKTSFVLLAAQEGIRIRMASFNRHLKRKVFFIMQKETL